MTAHPEWWRVQLPPIAETSAMAEGTADYLGGWVYRCYAADGALLYVGTTGYLRSRLVEHRRVAPWFREVERITAVRTLDPFGVECRAIREEGPRHNGTGVT